jgi:asparagine synthase (glutamine-hydrolysing)
MKYLAKRALKGRVPDEILNRKKAGFPIPYERWLQESPGGWVQDLLLSSRSVGRGYFTRAAIERVASGSGSGDTKSQDIFSLVVLELWHRAFVDRATS